MRRLPLLIAAFVLVAAILIVRQVDVPSDGEPAGGGPVTAAVGTVTAVADGDTVTVRMPGYDGPVRLIGIDTPEIDHPGKPGACFGEDAASATRAWVLGRSVRVEPGREQFDRYGRLLARLTPLDGPVAGRDLARVIALSGYARELPIAPNVDDAPAIAERVAMAERRGRGLWSACGFAAAFPGRDRG